MMVEGLAWMKSPVRWFPLMAAVLAVGALWTWVSSVPAAATTGGRIPSPREGFAAPDFTLDLLDGGQVTLSQLRGKAVVINLWASWCPPCRAEMPALQKAYEANLDRGLELVAVNTAYQDSQGDATAFARRLGLSFPIALDRDGAVSRRYLLRALPSTFFVDREGVIREVVIGGPMSEATILTAVEEILEEAR